MKKAILIAASLFTTAAAVTMGEAVKASPQFSLLQNTAGNLTFTGVGTATFNNAVGTNNSFQVGSNTSLGVNASTASTPEYGVTSHAKLDLAGNTTLQQVTGTSGASQNTTAEQIAAMTYAHDTASAHADSSAHDSASASANSSASASASASATETANTQSNTHATSVADTAQSDWETSNGSTWDEYVSLNSTILDDVTVLDSDAEYTTESEWTSGHSNSWQSTYDSEYSSTWQNNYDTAYESDYAAAYQSDYSSDYATAYESEYESSYNSTYTDSVAAIQSVTDSSSTDGTISGSFTTTESGAAASAATMSSWEDSAVSTASSSVTSEFGSTWDEYEAANSEDDGSLSASAEYQDQESWQDAYNSAYSTAYNDAYSEAASSATRTSDSQVVVKGLGSDAMVGAAATSTFDVQIANTLDGLDADSNATANGSAGANLSTASFANQSVSSTASAFMQSFGGVTLD
jgi:hypothetical protein